MIDVVAYSAPLRAAIVVVALVSALAASGYARGAAKLTPAEAAQHIGEQATVCGHVVSATFASRTRRQPTFQNLGKPYPQHIFTIVVWGANRPAFTPPPEVAYSNQRVCVSGLITAFRGRPQVVVTSPAQLAIRGEQ